MKCINCSNGVNFGNKHCIECLEKAKTRSAQRYEKMKVERKCKVCKGLIGEAKGIYCLKCKEDRKFRWHEKKTEGLCVVCGKKQATKGFKCLACYHRCQDGVNKKREERLAKGLCAFCDNERVGTRLCLDHYLKFTSKAHFRTSKRHQELLQIFKEQSGVCPYTGRKLTLGVDASLDHIVPKSRGGSNDDVANLQWVYCRVNFMKQDSLHDEFLDMIREIYENCITAVDCQ